MLRGGNEGFAAAAVVSGGAAASSMDTLLPIPPEAVASTGDEDVLQRRLAEANRADAAGEFFHNPRHPLMPFRSFQPHRPLDHLRGERQSAAKAGGQFFFDLGDPDDDDFERKFRDPNGIIFDINWRGWTMTSSKVRPKRVAAAKSKTAAKRKTIARKARRR